MDTNEPKRIELSQGKYALVDAEDFEELSRFKWSFDRYALRRPTLNGKTSAVYMHRKIMNAPPGTEVDHIDLDKVEQSKSEPSDLQAQRKPTEHEFASQ